MHMLHYWRKTVVYGHGDVMKKVNLVTLQMLSIMRQYKQVKNL